jgi:Na+-driven multidrug efflux pump
VIVNSCAVGLDIALHAILLRGVGSWNGLGFIGSPIGPCHSPHFLSYHSLRASFPSRCTAASSITAWLALVALVWYVFIRKKIHKKTWPGWNLEFMSWSLTKEFLLEQGIPAGIATSLEELQLEVSLLHLSVCRFSPSLLLGSLHQQAISFMAARLGDAPVSAHNSLLSLLLLMNAFSFGAINATT